MYTETNQRPWEEHILRGAKVYTFDCELPARAKPSAILAAAKSAGVPSGSSRSGAFEIHTDEGIYARSDGRTYGRLSDANYTFATWDAGNELPGIMAPPG
jgi:hypothetical protein